jgi:uncharacterized membrane protein
VTHFCAPTFVFLAGTGAFLFGTRSHSKKALSWFLLTRGLWLVLLEVTVVRFGWNFNLDYSHEFGGGVIWVIGWSMVILSALVFLPTSAVAVFGIAVIAFHNLWDGKTAADVGLPAWLWTILHQPGQFTLLPAHAGGFDLPEIHFGTGYSLVPWLGVLAAGYGFGAFYLLEPGERRRQLLGLGLALTLLFIVLRYANSYGDALRWSVPEDPSFTVLSFLNCQKYPPSLLFVLMTLGPAITALSFFERRWGPLGKFFITFGRVPLFYYLLHIPLIHGLVVASDYYRFGYSPFQNVPPWTLRRETLPEDYGYDLPMVYLIWLGVVLLLFPLCWWFAGVKQRHRGGWLSYL